MSNQPSGSKREDDGGEAVERFERTLRNLLNTPPKPHKAEDKPGRKPPLGEPAGRSDNRRADDE